MMLANLKFLKYVRSFTEGRVRLRHPALENPRTAGAAQRSLEGIPGIREVGINTQTGSVLLLYDPAVLDRETLADKGVLWAQWLDECLRDGTIRTPPSL